MKTPNTEQQIAFCQYYLEGYGQKEAAILAGYPESSAPQMGYKLRKEYEEYLTSETTANLKGGGALAYSVLMRLASTASHDSVKLKAATELLKFGGYAPVERQEIRIEQKSDEEIDAQLASLLGDKAKDVLRTLQ